MAVVLVDPAHPDPTVIADAAARLRAGELVAFPTETVYGLGANALDADAVARIYAAKGRPAWNPVIAHVSDIAAARALAREWPATAQRLAEAFWPGPLTLVVLKAAHVPLVATAGLDAVAVRVPAHPVALALLRAAAVPAAAPSANRFTAISPTTAMHVVQSLGDRVPLVLDGGACAVGIESTVVDCTETDVVILRPGMIGRESLEAVLADLGVAVRMGSRGSVPHTLDSLAPDNAPRGPGMADRHYAPKAEVWLFAPSQQEEMVQALAARGGDDGPVRALLRTTTLPGAEAVAMPAAPEGYARALYAALHDADASGARLVIIEAPPEGDEAWDGVRDRITRAAQT